MTLFIRVKQARQSHELHMCAYVRTHGGRILSICHPRQWYLCNETATLRPAEPQPGLSHLGQKRQKEVEGYCTEDCPVPGNWSVLDRADAILNCHWEARAVQVTSGDGYRTIGHSAAVEVCGAQSNSCGNSKRWEKS